MDKIKEEKKEKATLVANEKQLEKMAGLEHDLNAQQSKLREMNKEVVATLNEPAKGWVDPKVEIK